MVDNNKKLGQPLPPQSFSNTPNLQQEQPFHTDPHAADEIPSIIRRADAALRQHDTEQSLRKHEPNSYRPNYAHKPVERVVESTSSHNFDDLIGEIIRQQNNIREKKKGIFSIKTDNATKSRVLVLMVALAIVARVRAQQDDNQNTYDRLRYAQKTATSGQQQQKSERESMFENIEKSNLSKAVLKDSQQPVSDDHADNALRMSARLAPVPVLSEHEKNDRKLVAWNNLMVCAGQSVWSGYHSPGFVKLTDDLMVYSNGDAVYSFTPYFAGGQIVFDGWFWEQSLGRLASIIGQDMRRYFPTADFAFPYVHLYGRGARYQLPGAFYLKIRRGGGIVGAPVFRMGQPVKKTPPFHRMTDEAVMWVRDVKYLREEFTILLLREVEAQVKRFKGNKGNPWPLIAYNRRPGTSWVQDDDNVLAACQSAGDSLGSKIISDAAIEQRQRLRNNQNALWFPSLMIASVNMAGQPGAEPYWYPGRYTANELRACLLQTRIPAGHAFWATLGLTAAGSVKSMQVKGQTEYMPQVEACLRPVLRNMYFPGSQADDRFVSLLYRFQ
jgi:hypothetical protein